MEQRRRGARPRPPATSCRLHTRTVPRCHVLALPALALASEDPLCGFWKGLQNLAWGSEGVYPRPCVPHPGGSLPETHAGAIGGGWRLGDSPAHRLRKILIVVEFLLLCGTETNLVKDPHYFPKHFRIYHLVGPGKLPVKRKAG